MPLNDIQHIIFCMLENRSFDHMLGYLSLEGRDDVEGLKADPGWQASWTNRADGVAYPLNRIAAGDLIDDPPHDLERIKQQIETPAQAQPGMGGFVQTYVDSRKTAPHEKPRPPLRNPPGRVMGHYGREDVPIFDFFAREYCVCDHWFTPLPLGTQANRLMAMVGESKVVDNETGLSTQRLVYDWLSGNRVKWRVYISGGFFPFFTLMDGWTIQIAADLLTARGRFTRYRRFADDWRNAPSMPSVIFVEPEYSDGPKKTPNDDHPPTGIAGGQQLIADLYNILISNPERWARTLLVVTYDEHGGFFDHVSPLAITGEAKGKSFTTSGPRVPAFLVSPWIERRSVYSKPLDHTSFLALLAERFTPGHGYSVAVNARQAQLSGRLSEALRNSPRSGPTPVPTATAFTDGVAAAPPRAAPSAPDTPNAVAFDRVARRLKRERPDLVGHAEMGDLRQYLLNRPPAPLSGGLIEDAD
jgi:phospholipase C